MSSGNMHNIQEFSAFCLKSISCSSKGVQSASVTLEVEMYLDASQPITACFHHETPFLYFQSPDFLTPIARLNCFPSRRVSLHCATLQCSTRPFGLV